jgi:predicted nucleotidyltransferase
MSLLEMVAGLAEAGIRYIAVGGVAGVAHGSRRVTDDLDILYDDSPDNLDRLAALLASWHAYPRGIEPGLPFIMDAQTLRGVTLLTLVTDRGLLDLLREVKGVGDYARALGRSERVALDGGAILVLSLRQLIAAKRAAGRPKDREALVELEALLELRGEV